MRTATYHFKRDPDSANGTLSGQRARTDALGTVQSWATMAEGRSHQVLQDEDDFLVATLHWDAADEGAAALDLETLCDALGLRHDAVERPVGTYARVE